MAHLSYTGKDGKRTTAGLAGNRSLSAHLKDLGVLGTAAKNGVEKRENAEWITVPLTYVVRPSDELRVRSPVQSPPSGLAKIIQSVLTQVVPRRRSKSSK